MLPVTLVALLLGAWRITEARATSEELFDRALLAAALAVSRDVAVSGGDALLPATRTLIEDAAGGQIFYHVTGPQGSYVTGYAYPPVAPKGTKQKPGEPAYSQASYRGDDVRVLQMHEHLNADNPTGGTRITVWQRLEDRNTFTLSLMRRSAILIGGLIASLTAIIWLAVRIGLRPLLELEEAISLRSPDDLSPVRRKVPVETTGIVSTFNHLLSQIRSSIEAQQVFISDAAHQLRNPTAAVLALAETALDAQTEDDRNKRLETLARAARKSSRTAEQLLSLDRLQQTHIPLIKEEADLTQIASSVCSEAAVGLIEAGFDFEFKQDAASLKIECDPVLIEEALQNLIDNARKHGGPSLSRILVRCWAETNTACIAVYDDGVGIPKADRARALERFSQLSHGDGSGLGLSIVESIVARHSGTLDYQEHSDVHGFAISFPMLP